LDFWFFQILYPTKRPATTTKAKMQTPIKMYILVSLALLEPDEVINYDADPAVVL